MVTLTTKQYDALALLAAGVKHGKKTLTREEFARGAGIDLVTGVHFLHAVTHMPSNLVTIDEAGYTITEEGLRVYYEKVGGPIHQGPPPPVIYLPGPEYYQKAGC